MNSTFDPRAARRAQTQVVTLFLASALFTLLALVAYVVIPVDAAIKAAVLGNDKVPGIKTPENGVTLQTIADMEAGGYLRFLCVEAAVAHAPVTVAAGATWHGAQVLTAG